MAKKDTKAPAPATAGQIKALQARVRKLEDGPDAGVELLDALAAAVLALPPQLGDFEPKRDALRRAVAAARG